MLRALGQALRAQLWLIGWWLGLAQFTFPVSVGDVSGGGSVEKGGGWRRAEEGGEWMTALSSGIHRPDQ